MSLRARSKFVPDQKRAANAGVTLFCEPGSIEGHWLRIILSEKDVAGARIETVSHARPSEDLLILNPSRVLPTLADRDLVVYPARIIAEYLDERYPHPPLLPQEPSLRASLRMALDRIERDLFPLLQAGDADSEARFTEQLQLLSKLFPRRGWFLGLEYSIVDCAWIALLWRAETLRLRFPATIDPIRRYAQSAFARPAVRATLDA